MSARSSHASWSRHRHGSRSSPDLAAWYAGCPRRSPRHRLCQSVSCFARGSAQASTHSTACSGHWTDPARRFRAGSHLQCCVPALRSCGCDIGVPLCHRVHSHLCHRTAGATGPLWSCRSSNPRHVDDCDAAIGPIMGGTLVKTSG